MSNICCFRAPLLFDHNTFVRFSVIGRGLLHGSVPEECAEFLSNRELTTLLVKLSVKVWKGVCRSVNHVARAVQVHG